MPWNDLQPTLKELPPEQLLELLKGLHDLSAQNKAWLRGRVLPVGQDNAYLEECCQKVVRLVYNPARKFPDMPRFRDANVEKNAKLGEVSFKRLPVSAENNGNSAQTWNPGL